MNNHQETPDPAAEKAPEPVPFQSALEYLDGWFELLGPAREEGETAASLGEIPDFDERKAHLAWLRERTDRSVAEGVALPFEEYVRTNGLDLLDRVLLLALLRAAHDPLAKGGLRLVRVLRALGASTFARRWEVESRLETAGRLRDLGAVHGHPDPNRAERTYRLAPWLVRPLTTGEGSLEGLPDLSGDLMVTIDALACEAQRVMEAVNADTSQPVMTWQAPAAGPGWDHTALRRKRFTARIEACARTQGNAIGAEILRLGLESDERTCWGLLLWDGLQDPVGIPVPRLVRYCGETSDAAATAERLLGPGSKLGGADVVRFNRPDVPLLRRIAWMAREAHARVVPWSRDDFAKQRWPEGDPEAPRPRSFGFDAQGAMAEGCTGARRGAA